MDHNDITIELQEKANGKAPGAEMEYERLRICYSYASSDDRRVIRAVLNKYVPMLTAEGLLK